MGKHIIRFSPFVFAVAVLASCSLGKGNKQAPPVDLDPIQNCNGLNVELPHTVDAQKQGELLQFFAENIEPILEGRIPVPVGTQPPTDQIACINCHRAGQTETGQTQSNFSTGIGFLKAQNPFDPFDANTQHNYAQFLCTANVNYQDPAASRVMMKLRGKAGMDPGVEGLPPVPGLTHMDVNYVVGKPGDAVYDAFAKWVQLEADLRTPKGVGLRAAALGRPSQLCWTEDSLNKFTGGENLPDDGHPSTLLMCQGVNEHLELVGTAVDVTAMLGLAAPYSITSLVPDKGEKLTTEDCQGRLFVGLSESGMNGRQNLAQITIEFAKEEQGGFMGIGAETLCKNEITAASFKYIIREEDRPKCQTFRRDVERDPTTGVESVSMITRCADERPTSYAFGRVFYETNQNPRGDNLLNPIYPDPASPHDANPAISTDITVTGADSYHGGSIALNSYSVDPEEGIPHIFLRSDWHFHHHVAIGTNGKFNVIGWDNIQDGARWFSKGPAVWDNPTGVAIDLEAPLHGRSMPLKTGPDEQHRSLTDLMQKILPLSTGIVIGAAEGEAIHFSSNIAFHHENGAFALVNGQLPADRPSGILYPEFNAFDTGQLCELSAENKEDQDHIYEMEGLQGTPTFELTGSAMFMVHTEQFVNTCDLLADPGLIPHDMGIWWMDLNGNKKPVLETLPDKTSHFPNAYFVSDVAFLAPTQQSVRFVKPEIEEPKIATLYMPNARLYMGMKDNLEPKDQVFDTFESPASPYKLKEIWVKEIQRNPAAWLDTGVPSECRGCGSHPSMAGSEFASPGRIICKVPVKEDGSWMVNVPAGMGYSLLFVTDVQTDAGVLKSVIRQDGIRNAVSGINQYQAPVNREDDLNNCRSCHDGSKPLKDFILGHTGNFYDRRDTEAFKEGAVDCYDQQDAYYADYMHDFKPIVESKGCTDCHGLTPTSFTNDLGQTKTFDDTNPPGGLTFVADWHPTALFPYESSRYTYPYGHGDKHCPAAHLQTGLDENFEPICEPCDGTNVCVPHGTFTLFEPAYSRMMETNLNGVDVYTGGVGSRGASNRGPSIGGQCNSILLTLYAPFSQSGSCVGKEGHDGQPWRHPDDLYPVMTNPVTGLNFRHRGQINTDEAQRILDFLQTGYDFQRQIDLLVVPPGSTALPAGTTRWGLSPEP